MIIRPRFGLKAPIEGISFSNEEVSLEIEDDVPKEGWVEVTRLMKDQMKLVVQDYMDKLSAELKDGQSKVVEQLQIKLAKEYEDKLKRASEEIYKLRDLLKDNGISC